VNAPVRVLSDGQNAPSGRSTSGEQTVTDSTGAQAGPVSANAPVRVASDGDDAAGSGSTGGNQTSTGSDGSAQVGSAGANAPVRVLSDGENAPVNGSTGGEQTVDDSSGAAQVASPSVSAPIRVISEGDSDVGTGAQGEPLAPLDESSSPDSGTGAQGGPVGVVESVPDTVPAVDHLDGSSTSEAGPKPAAAVLGASAESLPLTGLELGLLLLMGLALVTSGAALRRGSVAAG
jgi:hypothetical protein